MGPVFLVFGACFPIVYMILDGIYRKYMWRDRERRIDDSVRPILTAKFRLGLFEKSIVDKDVSKGSVHTAEHQQTSLDIARESIVLLKNNGDLL